MLLYNFTTHVRRICNIAPHYAMRLCIQIGINLIAVDLTPVFPEPSEPVHDAYVWKIIQSKDKSSFVE